MIIGTAGHIDHGKTSLVRAITGVDADRLPEEKRRGITIDLGFAYWPQEDGGTIGFVDVPGHEGYVRSMLAGATGVSALLLVVAANEGARPQTLEHLMIADLLGIGVGVVALSKADLAEPGERERRIAEMRGLLAPTVLREAAIIPVSSVTGEGIEALKATLLALPKPAGGADRPFRLAIDRVFSLPGAGTVVTGGVGAGVVRTEDRLMLSPAGREVRVRGLHAQNRRADRAGVGERAAVNLAGIDRDAASRGDVLLDPLLHRPTQRFDAAVRLAPSEAKPLPAWSAVHLHAGTGAWPARLVPLSAERIGPGETGLAQIVLDRPAAILGGDSFVLRDAGGRRTIGGGAVLDIRPPERHRRRPERLAALDALSRHGAAEALPALLALPPYLIDLDDFALGHGLRPEALEGVIARENLLILPSEGRRMLVSPATVLRLGRAIREALAAHHAAQPDQSGLTAARLRPAMPERLAPEAFAALAAHLLRRGEIAAAGAWLRLPGHAPRLSAEHEALWAEIRPLLQVEARFKPPRVNELAATLRRREETVRGLCKRLARRGDLDEIVEDHFLLRDAVAELAEAARATAADGWFSAAQYRDRIGGGRRMAILILEFFDRHGLTIRKGDLRRIDPRKSGLFARADNPVP